MNNTDSLSYTFTPEFAPNNTLVVCWNILYNDLPYRRIVETTAGDGTRLMVVCRDEAASAHLHSLLHAYALPTAHIRFLIFDFNSIWVRDYAPLPVRTPENHTGLAGYCYSKGENRQRDLEFAAFLARESGLPLTQSNLVLSGGNFATDGLGTAICTDQVTEENAGREQEIPFFAAHGVRLLTIQRLPHEYTGHVDMLMKFVRPDVLLVASLDPAMRDYAVMENNIRLVQTQLPQCQIIRLPVAPDGGSYEHLGNVFYSYINSVMLKKTILLPLYGEATDDEATAIYQRLFPDHTIAGIYCKDLVQLKGALHCMTAQL